MDNVRRHLVLEKGEEVYIFAFEAGQETHVLQALIAQAYDSRTTFDWFDVALLELRLKEVSPEFTNNHGPVRMKPPNPATTDRFQIPCDGPLWSTPRNQYLLVPKTQTPKGRASPSRHLHHVLGRTVAFIRGLFG